MNHFQDSLSAALKQNKQSPDDLICEVIGNFMEASDLDRAAVSMTIASETPSTETCNEQDAITGSLFRKAMENYLSKYHSMEWEAMPGIDDLEDNEAEARAGELKDALTTQREYREAS